MSKTKKSGPPQFEEKEYDVSPSILCWLCLCPVTYGFSLCTMPYKISLKLGSEEVTKTDITLVGKSVANMPYGELGHVERSNCCCCVGFSGGFGQVTPGCGCDEPLVNEIVEELKQRQQGRGDQGQIQRQEVMMEEIEAINSKLDAIMDHLKMDRGTQSYA